MTTLKAHALYADAPVNVFLSGPGRLYARPQGECTPLARGAAVPGLVFIYFAQRHVDFNWRDNAIALRKSAVAALFTAAGPLAVVILTAGLSDISNDVLIVAVILAAIGWGAGLLATAHPLLPELQRVAEVFLGQ